MKIIEKVSDNIWKTYGVFEKKGKQVIITELPIGYDRESYIKVLDSLEDKEIVSSFVDECTESFRFIVDLKVDLTDSEIYEKFKLSETLNENLNVIDFDGKIKNLNVSDIIKNFTDYRLKLYLRRYKKQFFDLKDQFL
jgi:DNA gyrase/topoisomerase IV subunit A